jgi:fluoride ion exporter CrcB/FEX
VDDFLHTLNTWMHLGLTAMFGGLASYIYVMVVKGRKFRWFTFLANLFLAFFVGKALSGLIPPDSPNFSGYVMMLGFCAYPLLGTVEAALMAYVNNRTKTGGI